MTQPPAGTLQVEYIEFMKIMGVARFIICNERSDDDLDLLQVLSPCGAHTSA